MKLNTQNHLACCYFVFENILESNYSYSDAIDIMKKFNSRKKYGTHELFSIIKSIQIKKLSSIIEYNMKNIVIPNHKKEKIDSQTIKNTKWQKLRS